MAFVPTSSFTPVWKRRPTHHTAKCIRPRFVMRSDDMKISDGMDFFRYRQGQWASWRVTHHLAFRRSESGESNISMQCLESTDERIVNLCKDWDVDPKTAEGGCHVTWVATLDWDQEGENHEGETIFALVPEADNPRRGRMLRDRGYAEIVPIEGTYHLDDMDDLNLETPYEGGAVIERFSFDGPNIVNRLSTVKRFGGFSTATYANEQRVLTEAEKEAEKEKNGADDVEELSDDELFDLMGQLSLIGVPYPREGDAPSSPAPTYIRTSRWGSPETTNAKPTAGSAFSDGFGNSASSNTSTMGAVSSGFSGNSEAVKEAITDVGVEDVGNSINELAAKAGIDLSKIPPSMRDDFLATFQAKEKDGEQE